MDKTCLRAILKQVPNSSGVYKFLDKDNTILYIGKAKNLKKRISSYLWVEQIEPKTTVMLAKAVNLEWEICKDEEHALLTEQRLIKRYLPRYNKDLKDNKAYPILKLTNEKFPRLIITRRIAPDGAFYFGPYPSAKKLRQLRESVLAVFKLRRCRIMPKKACMFFHLNLCSAPCEIRIGKTEYRKCVENLKCIFSKDRDQSIRMLFDMMRAYSNATEYEMAGRVKELISVLTELKMGVLYPKHTSIFESRSLMGIVDGVDVSTLMGSSQVGVMVRFVSKKPNKSMYRKFKLRIKGQNDVEGIREIVLRAYSSGNRTLPHVLLVDGGLGQLNAALDALRTLNIGSVEVYSLAKREEIIYSMRDRSGMNLSRRDPILKLAQQVRDEAHRFAITYNRLIRKKGSLISILDEIPGIGPKRKQSLISFGDLKKIAGTSSDELVTLPGMNKTCAVAVIKAAQEFLGRL